MFVKICGTTNLEDAQLAMDLGADALGFIFAPSRRRVTAEQVAALTQRLSPNVMWVGVFSSPGVEEIVRTVNLAGLAAIQMHWSYNPEVVRALRHRFGDSVLLWQVVGFVADASNPDQASQNFAEELEKVLLDREVDYVLLDSIKAGSSGGLGETFAWQRAEPLVQAALRKATQQTGRAPRIVLAGGLSAENVTEAIHTLEPWGVDVVSGVETSPGKKSPDRLKAFLQAAKRT